jgi:hypothetical protein
LLEWRVALDKSEGVVKGRLFLGSAGAPLGLPEVEDQDSPSQSAKTAPTGNPWRSHTESLLAVELVPPTIDSATTSTMILLCEHRPVRDARAPNQLNGLARADQGHPPEVGF